MEGGTKSALHIPSSAGLAVSRYSISATLSWQLFHFHGKTSRSTVGKCKVRFQPKKNQQKNCGACFDWFLKSSAFPVGIGENRKSRLRVNWTAFIGSFFIHVNTLRKFQLCCTILASFFKKIPFFCFLFPPCVHSNFNLNCAGSLNIKTIKFNKIKLSPCYQCIKSL